MQTTGHLKINQKIILILIREKKTSRALKLRKSGKPGSYFEDESFFLRDEPVLLKQLLDGKVINC